MHRVPDYWYLFKLAVKAVIFVVIFGTLGWLLFSTPSGIPERPKDDAQWQQWADSLLPKLVLVDGQQGRQDIAQPWVDEGSDERRIWGPWENAEDRHFWTAYDLAYAERLNNEIRSKLARDGQFVDDTGTMISAADAERDPTVIDRAVVSRISSRRQSSERFCRESVSSWLDMEKRKFDLKLSIDGITELNYMRVLQAECGHWRGQMQHPK